MSVKPIFHRVQPIVFETDGFKSIASNETDESTGNFDSEDKSPSSKLLSKNKSRLSPSPRKMYNSKVSIV